MIALLAPAFALWWAYPAGHPISVRARRVLVAVSRATGALEAPVADLSPVEATVLLRDAARALDALGQRAPLAWVEIGWEVECLLADLHLARRAAA